jgi:hypothetical protein
MLIKNLAVKILVSCKIDPSRGAQDDKEKKYYFYFLFRP